MPKVINFYMDDSGTRHPDYDPKTAPARDWFALGGVLVAEADESAIRARVVQFREAWPQIGTSPLHSYDIRHRTKEFHWLEDLSADDGRRFMAELTTLMLEIPAVGLACVIDRRGYDRRYREKHGREMWSLCRTAFSVAVERATKFAQSKDAKLRVMPERCSKQADEALRGYYESLKVEGHPFNQENAAKYGPITPEQYRDALYEFRTKRKSSPMAQIADLYLWPMCLGGYHASNRPYRALREAGRLIDCLISEDVDALGIKYSCFENVRRTP